LHKPAIFPVFL